MSVRSDLTRFIYKLGDLQDAVEPFAQYVTLLSQFVPRLTWP